MKKHILLILCLCFFYLSSVTTYAKTKLGGFTELSDTDKQAVIQALVADISADLGIVTVPKLYFYSAKDWAVAASYYQGLDYIYINMSTFEDSTDAQAANETVEYHLVRIIAHEVRHDFQWEHQFDDSDYGRACLYGYSNYCNPYDDLQGYYKQFLEMDANQYAIMYADKYFK